MALSAPWGKAPCPRQHSGLCRPQGAGGVGEGEGRAAISELELHRCPYSPSTNEVPQAQDAISPEGSLSRCHWNVLFSNSQVHYFFVRRRPWVFVGLGLA